MSDDIHASSAAYALDALPADERATFEEHLKACGACRSEVAQFAATATRLGTAAATSPPARLREAVLAGLASTRQVSSPPGAVSGSRWGSRPLGWLLAAAALLLVVSGGVAVSQSNRARVLEAQTARITAILGAPDATTEHNAPGSAGSLTVVTSRQLDRAVVVVSGLPGLDAGRTYQMWLVGTGQPRPAGLLAAPTAQQPVSMVVPGVGQAREVAITVEPAGGSPEPTTTPVVGARLA